ncbi:MAG: DUF2236 domain-containing protein [Cellulomonadaceae bacterium]|nr:DUF2236 domain-containing protein [Cellulomonadaceae bacterium]
MVDLSTSTARPGPLAEWGTRRLRSAVAGAVLRRVAGPDPSTARDAIHLTPGPRWFAPDSAVARVHGDASMFVGGVRALLLQSLHPRAMAAVAAHSGYQSDPWGRLQRTATFLATTTFGTVEAAERMVRIVRAVHGRVSGVTPDGEPYEASDPHLLAWVHLAEVDSFLLAHQRYGRRPLDAAGCDEYVAQCAEVGHALGAVDLPTTVTGLNAALRAYRPELRGTPAAREAARFLLWHAPLPVVARPPYGAIAAAGVALMPSWSREPLGLPHLPLLEQSVVRGGGLALTAAIRWALDSAEPGRPHDATVAA